MAYIFDPLRNTFIDDEDTSLGNKLALVDDDELDKAIRELDEKFGPKTIKTLNELPENKPKEVEDTEAFNRFNKLYQDGGRVNFAAAGLALPALSYPVNLGIAKILGIATANVGAAELGNKVTDYLKENPEIINDPRFKGLAFAMGLRVPGVIAPDADEMEKVRQDIEKKLKPGETKPPKIDLTETFPLPEEELLPKLPGFGEGEKPNIPTIESFPLPEEQLPIIFENRKAATDDLKKDFDNKSWKDTLEVTGSSKVGTRESKKLKTNIPFFEKLNDYTKEYHGGNLKAAIKEISGIQTKPNVRNNKLESLYTSITSTAKRSDFKFDSTGNILQSNIPQMKNTIDLNVLTNTLKKDQTILDNRIKELGINMNEPRNKIELLDIFGVKRGNKRKENFFMELMLDQGLKYEDITGGKVGFKPKDVLKVLKDYSKNKLSTYEARSVSGGLRQTTAEKQKYRKKTDPGLLKFMYELNKSMRKNLISFNDEKAYIPNSTAEAGHNPVPVGLMKNIKFLNNKEIKDKLFSLQNMTWQRSEINRDLLRDTQGALTTPLKTLDKYFGKIKTEKNAKEIDEAAAQIEDYFDMLPGKLKKIKDDLYDANFVEENTFGRLIFTNPKVGEKITADNFNIDMSDVDPRFIMGNVDLINPNVKRYNNLSKEEKIQFGQNVLDQKIEQLKSFYKSADFDDETINEIVEALQFGSYRTEKAARPTEGIAEKKGFGFKKGGGVEITPMPRAEFGNGGAAGADDDFAAQLEYFFLNPDVELPAAKTFRETMNPVSIINDMIDPRNIPYYADRLVQSGIRIGEFGARVLPAVGQLAADLIQKPAFKIKPASGQGYVQDYADVPPSNITGTGIFSEFLNNLVGDEGTKVITEKTGLAKLIKDEEQKMKDERKTAGAKILADQFTLGMELTAPIFPGYKLLQAYAKSRKLPVDKTTREVMDKEIDEVLTQRGISRRDFMKVAGAGGAVAIAKLLGVGDEFATVTKVAEKAVPKGPVVPQYFYALVDKIKKFGEDKSKQFATMDREAVYVYKDYELYEDLSTGDMRVVRKIGDDMGYKEEEMVFTKGIGDESTKGTPPDEYDEFTVRSDPDGKMKNVTSSELEEIDDLVNEVGIENVTIKELEAMGYDIDLLPNSVREKLGLKRVSVGTQMLKRQGAIKNIDDPIGDLPDLP